MAESVLYVTWKDHSSELATVCTSLLENNFLVDCTISAGGQSLKAHKLVLCACSSYFHRLFQEETGKHTFVVLLDAPFELLKAMIEFMYRGETQISHVNLKAFLTLARFLQIKGLNNHSKDNASKNVSSSSTGNVPRGLSQDNQNTGEVTGIKACPKDSPENVSQPLPHRSTDYQDAVHANSSLPFEGYTASRDEACSSQEYQQPLRGDGVPVTMDVVVKSEPLYAVISETRNEEWRHVNSGEQVSGNFTNEMPQGTASALGEQDLNQYSNCPESSLGNAKSSEVLPPQQQHTQMEGEMSSDQDFVEQEECLPPAVFVPVNEESEEPMDIPRDNTHEMGKRAAATSSFLQHPSEDVILLEDDDDVQPIEEQDQDLQQRQPEPQPHQDRRAQKRQFPDDPVIPSEDHQAPLTIATYIRKVCREKPFPCDLCDMDFTDRQTLTDHRNTHPGARPYVCESCNKAYVQKKDLINHMSTHTGARPYACEFCNKTFVQKQDLTSHRRTHTGERPYRCDACGEAFARSDTLRTHKRKHTGERKYRCDDCGVGFHRPSNLAQHKISHAGRLPYRCTECTMTFINDRGLDFHRQKSHAGGSLPQ